MSQQLTESDRAVLARLLELKGGGKGDITGEERGTSLIMHPSAARGREA